MVGLHSSLVFIQLIVFCFADKTHYDSIPSVGYFRDKVRFWFILDLIHDDRGVRDVDNDYDTRDVDDDDDDCNT